MPRWKSSRFALDFQRGPNVDEIAAAAATGAPNIAAGASAGAPSIGTAPLAISTHRPVRSQIVSPPEQAASAASAVAVVVVARAITGRSIDPADRPARDYRASAAAGMRCISLEYTVGHMHPPVV